MGMLKWLFGKSEPDPTYSGRPLSHWLRALQSADPETRDGALDALRPIGPEAKAAIPALVELMGSDDVFVGAPVSCLLGQIGPAALPALMEALSDLRPSIRWGAVSALGERPSRAPSVTAPR